MRRDLLNRHLQRHAKGMWFRRTGTMPNHIKSPTSSRDTNDEDQTTESSQISDQALVEQQSPPSDSNNLASTKSLEIIPLERIPIDPARSSTESILSTSAFEVLNAPVVLEDEVYNMSKLFQDVDFRWLFESDLDLRSLSRMGGQAGSHNFMSPQIDSPLQFAPSSGSETSPIGEWDNDAMWTRVKNNIVKSLFGEELESASNSPLQTFTLGNIYSSELLDSWLCQPALLEEYFLSYFESYHDHFPILHKPTFLRRPDKVNPLLMIAMATLGTVFAPKHHFEISIKLHERLQFLILSHMDLLAPPLWVFQSLVLVQAFEKMLSSRAQHELSAIFHGSMVILIRRIQSYTNLSDEDVNSSSLTVEEKWSRWIKNESMRRVFFLAFIIDAQHVALFGHRACMSANEILFQLPCLESVWDSDSAEKWYSIYHRTETNRRETSFLSGLKSLLLLKPLNATTSHFSRLILLHGLYSVIVQMQLQEGLTLGVKQSLDMSCQKCGNIAPYEGGRSQDADQWKSLLCQVINTWSYCLLTQNSMTIEVCHSLHQMAYVLLYLSKSSVFDILLFGGLSLVYGKPRETDYIKADMSVKAWSGTYEALLCVKHSLLLVQEVLFSTSHYYSEEYYRNPSTTTYCARYDKIALRPWCLFVCTLVLWAFHSSIRVDNTVLPTEENIVPSMTEQFIVDRLRALSSPNPISEFHRLDKTNPANIFCLIAAVQSSLEGCRWEMLDQAYSCLGRITNAYKA